jgi:hypothetical protein
MKSFRAFHPVRDIERILALVATIGVTAAIGLASVDPMIQPRALPADANAQRGGAPVVPSGRPADRAEPLSGELDPALRRIDHAGAHHG